MITHQNNLCNHCNTIIGRVVSWKEIGIQASYTIEASFCGAGVYECVVVCMYVCISVYGDV